MSGLREKLRAEIASVDAAALVPHHHRGALFVLETAADILDVALAIAEDDSATIEALLADGRLRRPSSAELADWCVDGALRFQFVILQPFVLAQPILPVAKAPESLKN